ncbi:MAG: hypothetical protein V1710_01835 [Candidatus Bathyarchaeota archaeon]
MGHSLVTSHYVNGDVEYPVGLMLYVKRETCVEERRRFRTKIELAVEQIKAFKAPTRTCTVVAFDSGASVTGWWRRPALGGLTG